MSEFTEKEWYMIEQAVKQMRFQSDEYYELLMKIREVEE